MLVQIRQSCTKRLFALLERLNQKSELERNLRKFYTFQAAFRYFVPCMTRDHPKETLKGMCQGTVDLSLFRFEILCTESQLQKRRENFGTEPKHGASNIVKLYRFRWNIQGIRQPDHIFCVWQPEKIVRHDVSLRTDDSPLEMFFQGLFCLGNNF